MADFSYRLVVLSHPPGDTLPAALAAFEQHATPQPAEVAVVVDGSGFYTAEALEGRFEAARVTVWPDMEQRGFCAATARAWKHAAEGPGPLHVFYLEHDFVLTHDVNLADLAAVLDVNPKLSQMALMRNAVNEEEKAAGGLFEFRQDQYEPRWENPTPGDEFAPAWHEHLAYVVTTNPSLLRRSFMQEHPWPADLDSECEGHFGIRLRNLGFSAGVWGDGSVYCEHVGIRSGYGY